MLYLGGCYNKKASSAKRGVLFTLLLGFMLQSIIVVASEFFSYQAPSFENYFFIGACCLMLFCMKLLYVDDADVPAEDHASRVNWVTATFFNVGQFALMLSTTILGSGLNLLTHDYLSATQALSGPSKGLVCGGFSASLMATFFIKSLHVKRIPADGLGQCLFIAAYLLQASVLLAVVGVTAAMTMKDVSGLLAILLQSDILLLFFLSGAAVVVVIMHWLDEGVELALYGKAEMGRSYRVHPFGYWCCVKPGAEELNDVSSSPLSSPPSSARAAAPMASSAMAAYSFAGLDSDIQAMFGSPSRSIIDQREDSSSSLSIVSPLLQSGGGSTPKDYDATSSPAVLPAGEFV